MNGISILFLEIVSGVCSVQIIRRPSVSRWRPIAIFFIFFGAMILGRAESYGDYTFTVTNASVTITKYTGPGGTVIIPETILDIPVTSLGMGAFQNCANLETVTIAGSVTNIGDSAFFGCGRLMTVTIPDSVASIGNASFFNCTNLSYLNIANGLSRIGDLAFHSCISLTNLTIPESVTAIGADAFFGCSGLKSITIPGSIITIETETFSYCSGLTNVTIPKSVANIGDGAFENCIGLTNIIIPNSVTNIGDWAFSRCTSLKSVTIGSSITRLGVWAFSFCNRLVSVLFEGNAPTSVSNGLFSSANQVTVYYRAGTAGWEPTIADRPTAIWIPTYLEWAKTVGLLDRYPNASAESNDPDQDGMSNLAEMQAGTDPTDPKSVLRFENVPRLEDLEDGDKTAIGSDQVALYLQTVPGKQYKVQSVSAFGQAWQDEAGLIATTSQKRFVVDKPLNQGIYRVELFP